MTDLATTGYTVEDLDWLRDATGVAHLELDPWGSLIVSPATDEHEIAQSELVVQAALQLRAAGYRVVPSMPWCVPGGTGYYMIPDVTVLPVEWHRMGDFGIDPPPLLVVEIASASTRHADRTRKLADYRAGGAGIYLLVDLPATFEAHDFATRTVVRATGEIDLAVGGHQVRFTLPPETGTGSAEG